MKEHLLISIRITVALLVITCGVYPLAVWAVGQTAFHDKANGSLILRDGKVIGSEIIGQGFSGERFFHPRPSAAGDNGYDGMASGGTNYGPTSKKLLDAISDRVTKYGDTKPAGGIPADAVTASCSGLDPHISPENAASQSARVARANRLTQSQVDDMIRKRTESRFLGIYGEPRVNVLMLNLDLREVAKRKSP
jgi:potassium-transporting ATPase KdpC subunit